MPHTVNDEELEACQKLLQRVIDSRKGARMTDTMKVTRVYADANGESHFADQEIPLRDAGQIGHLSQAIPAKSRHLPQE